jgi:hypothetical protein
MPKPRYHYNIMLRPEPGRICGHSASSTRLRHGWSDAARDSTDDETLLASLLRETAFTRDDIVGFLEAK